MGGIFLMLSKRLNKYLVVLLSALFVISAALSVVFLAPSSTRTARAATQYMTVQKVFVADAQNLDDPRTIRHVVETETAVANNDFVMLDTSQRQFIDASGGTHIGREAILIRFPGTPTSKGIPTVSVRFNNNLLSINEVDEPMTMPATRLALAPLRNISTP